MKLFIPKFGHFSCGVHCDVFHFLFISVQSHLLHIYLAGWCYHADLFGTKQDFPCPSHMDILES